MANNHNIIQSLQDLMQNFFKNDKIQISNSTSAKDIEEWDSLNHMMLISTIEAEFNIQFDFFEVMEFENVGELVSSINKKM